MAKYPEEFVEKSQRNPAEEEHEVHASSIGYLHSDPISGDSHSTMRTTHFETYAQYGKFENTNQIMDAALNIIVSDPHDPYEAAPVIEKLKELWREGDTVGTLLNRYRRSA